MISALKLEEYCADGIGMPTLEWIRDRTAGSWKGSARILHSAAIPGGNQGYRRPERGHVLEGSVTNVTNFGAFVDIGIQQDGLVHLSQMSNRFIRDPREAVKVGDLIQVKVISIEVETKRIGLSMKALLPALQRRKKKQQRRGQRPQNSEHKPEGAASDAAAGAEQSSPAGSARKTSHRSATGTWKAP